MQSSLFTSHLKERPWYHLLLDFLFPCTCIGCHAPGTFLCMTCKQGLGHAKDATHAWITSGWDYHHPLVEKIIRHLKHAPHTPLVHELLSLKISDTWSSYEKVFPHLSQPIIVPIPLHTSRRRERGFNQTEIIGEVLARVWNCSYMPHLLSKSKNTAKQGTRKSRAERMHNMSSCFATPYPHLVLGASLILVDDVLTTGSTLQEARKTLLAAGAREVYALTLAN